jgi:hypothetical protein
VTTAARMKLVTGSTIRMVVSRPALVGVKFHQPVDQHVQEIGPLAQFKQGQLRREDLQERSGKDPVALALMHFPEQGQIRDFGFFAGTHAATFQIV